MLLAGPLESEKLSCLSNPTIAYERGPAKGSTRYVISRHRFVIPKFLFVEVIQSKEYSSDYRNNKNPKKDAFGIIGRQWHLSHMHCYSRARLQLQYIEIAELSTSLVTQ